VSTTLPVASLWLAAATMLASPAHSAADGYRSALAGDGTALRSRAAVLRALREDPRAAARHAALTDSLSALVHCSRPQVVADFRDGSHRVEIPAAPHLDYTDAFSYSLWMRLDVPAMVRETKILSHAGVQTGKVTLTGDGRRVALLLRHGDGTELSVRTIAQVQPHRWVHVGVAFSCEHGASIYLDGARAELQVLRGDPETRRPLLSVPAQEIYVGGPDRAFPGMIDDLRVSARRLSGREFRDLAAGKETDRGLLGHWPFDGDRGSAARDTSPFRHDARIGAAVRAGRPGKFGTCVVFTRDKAAWTRRLVLLQEEIAAIEARAAAVPRARDEPAAPRDGLCLAGVVLAGTARLLPDGARGADEGLLSAAEVAHLDLSSARLVTWSGCGTAGGTPAGTETLRGLAAAAWLAGAPCSVACLWDVPDMDMPAAMRALYGAWLGGASPARAVQAAQVAAMSIARAERGDRHPARWAALVVEGVR
jgi:hypothetical protein